MISMLDCSAKRISDIAFFMMKTIYCLIPLKVADNLISRVISLEAKYLEMCDGSFLSKEMKNSFKDIIHNRIVKLTK